MADTTSPGEEGSAPVRKGRGRRGLLLVGAAVVAAGSLGGAAVFFVPGVGEAVKGVFGGGAPAVETTVQARRIIEIPEMTVTLPNNGRTRQMKVRIALEIVASIDSEADKAMVLGPRVSDALVAYASTLRDGEWEGPSALDRLRGDLFRRMDLVLGGGRLVDVLVTGLIVADASGMANPRNFA